MVHTSDIVSGVVRFLEYNINLNKNLYFDMICEIGCGMGWLSYWIRLIISPFPFDSNTWISSIVGIDAFKYYADCSAKRGYYDFVKNLDITDVNVLETIKDYDLVIGIEIVEHLSDDVVYDVIRKLVDNNKSVFLTTRTKWKEQLPKHGNIFQSHKSFISRSKIENMGLNYKIFEKNTAFIFTDNLMWFGSGIFTRLRHKLFPLWLRKYLKNTIRKTVDRRQ